jgi:hypothetical protein
MADKPHDDLIDPEKRKQIEEKTMESKALINDEVRFDSLVSWLRNG